nr:6-phosphogluconolactonase [Corynebacterium poyangense]
MTYDCPHSALPHGENVPHSGLNVEHVADQDDLTRRAARRLTQIIQDIQSSPTGGAHHDGIARIVLTGGGTGIGVLKQLASFGADIDHHKVEIFFGDERNVPVSDPESNEGQARRALLDHWQVPEDCIHGYGLTGGDMMDAVTNYRRILKERAPRGFDVHLLGMGEEGHINSLFPHSAALHESIEQVVPVYDSPKPPAERVTLTTVALEKTDRIWLLVSGSAKAEAAHQVINHGDPQEWPAAGISGRIETTLYLSEDASANSS